MSKETNKTSKFNWRPDDIRIEKIILDVLEVFAIFFWSFQLYYKLDIVPSCNPVQYQGKLMMQTWENGENSNFELNFGPLNFFLSVSFISTSS